MPKRLMQGGALPAIVAVCFLIGGVVQSSAQTTSLPSPWVGQDIGSPSTAGRSSAASGTFTVTGSGRDIGGTADQFHFVYQPIAGDTDIRVRLSNFTFVDWTAKAGVMIRESLAGNASNVYAFRYPDGNVSLRSRTSTGGGAGGTAPTAAGSVAWLRLVRTGNVFTGYSSTDGTTWTTIGSQTVTMAATVYVGMAVTSYNEQPSATGTFTSVQVTGTSTAPASLPAPWLKTDVGSPSIAGTASAANGTFTVDGAGTDIGGTADQFQFAYQAVQGDIEIIARVASLQQADSWSKAGVMVRSALSAGSVHATMLASSGNGWRFKRRIATDGSSYDTAGPAGTAPGWVRLVREGTLLSAYQSTDGSTWTLVGTDNLALGSTFYVGLAVTSHVTTSKVTATFTNVAVRPFTPGNNQAPTVSLTSPSSGATFTAPATIAMSAAASDSDGSVSKVDFYSGSQLVGTDTTSPFTTSMTSVAAGTYSLKAVATDNDGATASSSTVSVTVNGSGNTPPSVAIASPASGTNYSSVPAEMVITATASDADGISRVDLYEGSTLLKSDKTVPFSYRWSRVPAGTYQLTAVAFDKKGASNTSSVVTITVGSSTNQPPAVSITSPSSGSTFTAGANIAVQASASDSDGTVSRVEFYYGGTLIATDTTSPYTTSWNAAAAGSYTLTAKAVDDKGASRTSTAINVTVNTASNQMPNVSITSPSAGASFTAPASVTMTATASDSDGTIAGVDFYVGSTMIGTDTTSPYTASWTNVAAGTYSLTARARDNAGGTRTSGAVAVTVNGATTLPTKVVFVPSTDNATNVSSYVVAIYRGSDPTTGSPVATRDLGKPTAVSGEITVDISTLIDPLAAGTYKAVVRAVGPGGTTPSSPSATFTK